MRPIHWEALVRTQGAIGIFYWRRFEGMSRDEVMGKAHAAGYEVNAVQHATLGWHQLPWGDGK